jgi:hypothetical protein
MTTPAYGTSHGSESIPTIDAARSDERSFQLLLSELDCGEAMAGLAIIATDFENFRRTYNNARQCYEWVVSQLLQLSVPAGRLQEIDSRLCALRSWLDIAGPRLDVES